LISSDSGMDPLPHGKFNGDCSLRESTRFCRDLSRGGSSQ